MCGPQIFETFGSVTQPFYSLRFPASALPDPTVFTVGKAVYYCPKMASFVFTRDLRAMKGSDASNVWDEEVGAAEMEWSDDEAEQEYKRSQKAEYVFFLSMHALNVCLPTSQTPQPNRLCHSRSLLPPSPPSTLPRTLRLPLLPPPRSTTSFRPSVRRRSLHASSTPARRSPHRRSSSPGRGGSQDV